MSRAAATAAVPLEQAMAPAAPAGLLPRASVWIAVLLLLLVLIGFAIYDLVLREPMPRSATDRVSTASPAGAPSASPTAGGPGRTLVNTPAGSGANPDPASALGPPPAAADIQALVDSQVARAAPPRPIQSPGTAAANLPLPPGTPDLMADTAGAQAAAGTPGHATASPATEAEVLFTSPRLQTRAARAERLAEAASSRILASPESSAGDSGPPSSAGNTSGAPLSPTPAELRLAGAGGVGGVGAAGEPLPGTSGIPSNRAAPEADWWRNLAQAQAGGGASNTRSSRDEAWLRDMAQPKPADAAQAELPASTWMVFQGTRIPVVTREALNSDLPGPITAMATAPVYDSIRQCALMVPPGTRFIGQYNSDIHAGQSRVLLAFRRMILPDGRSVELSGAQGVDAIGQAGTGGNVDNHFLQMFGYGFAMAWIGQRLGAGSASVTVTQPNGQSTNTTVAAQVLGDTASRILSRNAVIPPTITVDVGARLYVTVTRDISLAPFHKTACL